MNTPNKLQIAKGCSGSPLALIVTGTALSHEAPVVWHNRAKTLSKGHSILAYSSSNDALFTCLQKCFDDLNAKVAESFMDLSLFPEAQKIPAAALVDIWAEQRNEDDGIAMENIYELVKRNVADIVVTRYGELLFLNIEHPCIKPFQVRLFKD